MKIARKVGRPVKEVNKELFEKLCGLHCTLQEIAGCLGVSDYTLEKWCEQEYGKKFLDVFKEKSMRGNVSLRRMQWKLAEKSPAMAIFLGKNFLGQKDERDVEVRGNLKLTTLAELMLEEYNGQDADSQST